ncbi:MAG TPA: hypothetical protein VKD67_05160 [Acidimicrobiales bacterium]|nr:hypothetical protein [Acidimicrobiales bacterium]
MATATHLVRRFFGSLSTAAPAPDDEAWAESFLLDRERAVWRRMANQDRRHAVGVARRVADSLGADPPRPVVAAALLHDCGKVDAGLGTFARVGATVAISVTGRDRAGRGEGRVARYARHESIGAAKLRAAGSEPVTIALVGGTADAPSELLALLRAADDSV